MRLTDGEMTFWRVLEMHVMAHDPINIFSYLNAWSLNTFYIFGDLDYVVFCMALPLWLCLG